MVKRADKGDDLAAVRPPGRDDDAGPVTIKRLSTGQGVLVPIALRQLRGEALELVADLQHAAVEIGQLLDQVDELVPHLRELGVSWNSIGWCTGMTGKAAQMRWGPPRK